MAGASASFDTEGDVVTVSVTSASLHAGSQYVILMIKSTDGENFTIDAGSVLYIDQAAAASSGENGTVTFDVYPSSMTDSVILIAGAADGLLKAAVIEGKYVLGDVNDDGYVNADDALQILRHAAGYITLGEEAALAANTHKDGYINADDALMILRYAAGFIGSF